MKKAFAVISVIGLLACGLFAVNVGCSWWQLHWQFASNKAYSPAMFLLLTVGMLQAICAFSLPFVPRRAGIVGAATLIVEAAFCVFYLPLWWLIVAFAGVASMVYLRFVRRPTLLPD